jgi:spermidine/putrescine transport system ATP-binding protein
MSESQRDGVVLDHVSKRFADVKAVDDVSLEVRQGEFFSLLGPSGCGKTTTLRMIAGFERLDTGRILIGDVDVTQTPPHRRPVNTVFQSYALFPHLSVADNVAFGLRFRRLSSTEKKSRVQEMLELVRLQGYGPRKPHQLSGGQQQRVALARSLILSPAVLLLDEPLGALDAKLRRELQIELKRIQREVGITFVYVTHDQEEALTMSDRMGVMSGGHIEQLDSARTVYEEPETTFVADFLGVSNLMPATCDGQGGVVVDGVRLDAERGRTTATGTVRLTIRPERIEILTRESSQPNSLDATVESLVYLGSTTQVHLRLPSEARLQALVTNVGDETTYREGDAVKAHLPRQALRVLVESPTPAPLEAEPEADAT